MYNVDKPLAPEYLPWQVRCLGLGHLGSGRRGAHNGHIQLKLGRIEELGIGKLAQGTRLVDDMADDVGPDDKLLAIPLQLQFRVGFYDLALARAAKRR